MPTRPVGSPPSSPRHDAAAQEIPQSPRATREPTVLSPTGDLARPSRPATPSATMPPRITLSRPSSPNPEPDATPRHATPGPRSPGMLGAPSFPGGLAGALTGSPKSTGSTPGSGSSTPGTPGSLLRKRKARLNLETVDMKLNLSSLEQRKRPRLDTHLPPDLRDKSLAFTGERLGEGSNGVVMGLAVDGRPSDRYVVKTSLMQGDRVSQGTTDMLRREIEVNRALKSIDERTPLTGVLVGAGTASIDHQTCLVLPRVHGEPLVDFIRGRYEDARLGRIPPRAFVASLREALATPMRGLAAMHDAGWVMNDLNAGNFLHGRIGGSTAPPHGIVIDFGCAGESGQAHKPGTIGTLAPERIEASDDADAPRTANNHPLSPKSDAYSLGCVMHHFVHGRYPSWSDTAPALPQDRQMLELSTSADAFRARGTLFPNTRALSLRDLRSGDAGEIGVRVALLEAGFYDVLEGLTRPDPQQRLSIRDALAMPFFARTDTAPSTSTVPPRDARSASEPPESTAAAGSTPMRRLRSS